MYGRFRTGDNKVDTDAIETAKVLALEQIARMLERLVKVAEENK